MMHRLLVSCLVGWSALSGAGYGHTYPDATLTPGGVDPAARQDNLAQTVCSQTWVKAARDVSESEKRAVCAAYGARGCPGPEWEIDHFIPLELGGSNDSFNLWPQPIDDAREKDRVENWLHRQVCHGDMLLEDAQRFIEIDWVAVYQKCCQPAGRPLGSSEHESSPHGSAPDRR